ncbi:MAG TPA: radical SAM protein [Thermodesulfobacteriota bacterium]|nr:radical SAM protein [Thermodesulfobacteriota bacterium]
MEKLREREHDFGSKLRQDATLQRLKDYIEWQRDCNIQASGRGLPIFSPISINLDLTSACNFSCHFCVDSRLINAGKTLALEEVKKTIHTLHSHGLLSVILIGGGEPTLHRDFGQIVRYIKGKRLQVGIVTNGSQLERIETVVQELKEKDWVRISIDAAGEEVFKALHVPRTRVTLRGILEKAKKVKKKNPLVSLGYSFVVVWEGVEINRKRLRPNLDEMTRSVELAREFSFDYVSFKPCLVRWNESQRETLLKNVGKTKEEEIIDQIKIHLQEARHAAGDQVKILESSNLKAMLNREIDQIKQQPARCHMQFFRTVVTPFGIFHCPAFRGVEEARVGMPDGYLSETKFRETFQRAAESIRTFDAKEECKDVGCFYNRTNWWLEELIHSKKDVRDLEKVENDNFFL